MKICCKGEIRYNEVDGCVRRSEDQRFHYKQTVTDFLQHLVCSFWILTIVTFVLRIYNTFDLQNMHIHFRFSPEEVAKRDSFCYLPYGQGPRMCPGLKFADLQVKVALVKLLQKFVIKPCQQTIVSTYCVIQCKAVMFSRQNSCLYKGNGGGGVIVMRKRLLLTNQNVVVEFSAHAAFME